MTCIDFNVPKNKECILIDTNKWLKDDSSLIQSQKISGKLTLTYITEVESSNLPFIKEGQTVLLSRVISEIAQYSKYIIEDKSYYNVPESQILGTFETITLEGLTLLNDKIIVKKVENTIESELYLTNANVMIGEVLKTGSKVQKVKVQDKILIRDNISTEVKLNNESYYVLEERMVVGIFGPSFNIEDLKLINESILMKPYINSKVLNSSLLISPDINYEDLDYSDMYNRDLFKVEFLDESLKHSLKEGDIIILNRDFTNYVYYGMEKYFIVDGFKYITALVKE